MVNIESLCVLQYIQSVLLWEHPGNTEESGEEKGLSLLSFQQLISIYSRMKGRFSGIKRQNINPPQQIPLRQKHKDEVNHVSCYKALFTLIQRMIH